MEIHPHNTHIGAHTETLQSIWGAFVMRVQSGTVQSEIIALAKNTGLYSTLQNLHFRVPQ